MKRKLITLWLLFFAWLFFGARPVKATPDLPPELPVNNSGLQRPDQYS